MLPGNNGDKKNKSDKKDKRRQQIRVCSNDKTTTNNCLSRSLFQEGTKSLNTTHLVASHSSMSGDKVVFVSVFTISNSSSENHEDNKFSDIVTVGNSSYTKLERSMAILKSFLTPGTLVMCDVRVVMAVGNASADTMVKEKILEEISAAKIDVMGFGSQLTSLLALVEKIPSGYKSLTLPHNLLTNSISKESSPVPGQEESNKAN